MEIMAIPSVIVPYAELEFLQDFIYLLCFKISFPGGRSVPEFCSRRKEDK